MTNNDFAMNTNENLEERINNTTLNEATSNTEAILPSMKDFEEELNRSFQKIDEGTLLKGVVIGITDTKVILDLGYYAEGIIPIEELSHDPRFSIKTDVTIGEEIHGIVIRVDKDQCMIILSKKQADTLLSFKILKDYMDKQIIKKVKIAEVVNGGVITYLEGI